MSKQQKNNETNKHIRGSSLLLSGRFISLGINFLVQILTVWYLTKEDYGAFAYALTFASIGSSIALFSLDKAISRFLPIYEENDELPSVRGAVILTLFSIIGLSLAIIFLIYGLQSVITETLAIDDHVMSVLLVVIWLSPIGAIDNWFQSIFAVFAGAREIFLRRYILGPGLKLAAIILVMLSQGNVIELGIGYVVGGLIGLLAYALLLQQIFKKREYFQKPAPIKFPFRDIYTFSAPLMYSDFVFIMRNNILIIIIEFFGDTTQVADYRAVVPLARLNQVVLQSFTFLYTPLAARMYAKKDTENINDLYWRTAIWILIFSFPVFSLTFSLAQPVTDLILPERYADSSIILAILSLGYYFNAALGFNAHTLRVYGVIRYIVIVDMIVAAIAVISAILLISNFGALGAALSATGTLILHNLLNHFGLYLYTDIHLFNWKYITTYIMVILASIALFLLQFIWNPPIYISLFCAALTTIVILRLNRKKLVVLDTFPELLKVPFMKQLLADE